MARTVISARRAPPGDVHPAPDTPAYRSTALRHPKLPPIAIPQGFAELSAPVFDPSRLHPLDHDLTRQHAGEPVGQRIVVAGRVLDEDGRAVPRSLVEIWQANSAGRYAHAVDQTAAPLDPNFTGAGRALTDEDGRYRFVTIRPGAYPWKNHDNAWRPAHIHFSILGEAFVTRLVTQMYFPGDPLLPLDPIFNAAQAPARQRLVSAFDLSLTTPGLALGYRFDLVLRGERATPWEA